GLFILGPERLPEAMAWVGRTVRKVRDFATGARDQLRTEMGSEFDEFRKPIEDLRSLRNFDPKRAVTQHLFDGDPDPLGLKDFDDKDAKPNGYPAVRMPQSLSPGEKPPVDPDAT
ncbi:MAG: Sec-independent protein translocase TatB, partial [Haloechinothrix sp.]